jgi:XRE family transcriptional regulator of biofilm formation
LLGERIKRLRERNGYSITELAKLANVSKSYLSLIERDIKKNPSLLFLNKMAETLNISLEYLLGKEKLSTSNYQDCELDKEWTELVLMAINNGACKVDFRNYLDSLKCEKNK